MYTILGVIAKPLGMLLNLLYGFVQNYGLTIIIFTLIVKLCLYPLYIKQTKSTARMAEVQPKMQALQNKYANDKETLNIKMAELYKEEKFNPMGGCLPMLIQMPIIMGLFEKNVPVDSITVMVQKEVADRMQVGPGTKDYGALSLAVQYYAKPEIVANVPPNCFMPRPKVGSAVIKLTRYEKPPVEVQDERLMFRLIRASFNQRRKTLVNSIKNSGDFSLGKEEIENIFEKCGLPLNIRGEALTLEQFAMLANCISEEKNNK